MGQAEVRRAAHQRWMESLSEADRVTVTVASRLHSKFPLHGACYRTAMFLGYHLATKHGIEAEVVIGYVNDGTDDLYASHAWIESGGRITDVAISRPEEPRLQKSGPLMILGTTVKPGWNGYTYHREMPPVGVEAARKMGADPRTRSQLAELDSRHAMMTAMAKDPAQMLAYLDGAPDGMDYRHMAGLVDELCKVSKCGRCSPPVATS